MRRVALAEAAKKLKDNPNVLAAVVKLTTTEKSPNSRNYVLKTAALHRKSLLGAEQPLVEYLTRLERARQTVSSHRQIMESRGQALRRGLDHARTSTGLWQAFQVALREVGVLVHDSPTAATPAHLPPAADAAPPGDQAAAAAAVAAATAAATAAAATRASASDLAGLMQYFAQQVGYEEEAEAPEAEAPDEFASACYEDDVLVGDLEGLEDLLTNGVIITPVEARHLQRHLTTCWHFIMLKEQLGRAAPLTRAGDQALRPSLKGAVTARQAKPRTSKPEADATLAKRKAEDEAEGSGAPMGGW